MDKLDQALDRWSSLKSERTTIDNIRDRVSRVIAQSRIGFTTRLATGQSRTTETYSSVPALASEFLSKAIESLIMSLGDDWVRASTGNDDINDVPHVAEWLDQVNQRLRRLMRDPASNLGSAAGEVLSDLVNFGMGTMMIDERSTGSGVHYQAVHQKNVWIDVGYDNNVTDHFVLWPVTVGQAARKFGVGKLSEKTRKLASEGKLSEEVEILHVVRPRLDRDMKFADRLNMPFGSLWLEPDNKHTIAEGGYVESPYVSARWRTVSGDKYGWGPGLMALPESQMLMEQRRTLLSSAQLATQPPILMPDEGVSITRLSPGARVVYEIEIARQLGRVPIEPLSMGGSIALTRDMVIDTENMIWKTFLRDLITLPTDGPQMTATEIVRRHEDKVRILGPTLGRLETELNLPMVARTFGIMLRQQTDLVDTMPEDLSGEDVNFIFKPPIQEDLDAERAMMVAERIAGIAQIESSIIDNVDWDAFSRDIIKTGPERWLRPVEEVADLRRERADSAMRQAQQEQLAMQAQPQQNLEVVQ